MKLTFQNIIDAKNSVLAVGNAKSIEGMPVQGKIAYKIKKFQDRFIKEFNVIEPLRVDIFKRFGKQDEKGYVSVFPEKFKEFQAEMKKFLETESETEAPLMELGMVDGISANDISCLEGNKMLKEIEEK